MSMSDDDESDGERQLRRGLAEEEGVVVPRAVRASVVAPSKDVKEARDARDVKEVREVKDAGRSRRGTLDALLAPLTNFIDLCDDDAGSRAWRSFVEFSA